MRRGLTRKNAGGVARNNVGGVTRNRMRAAWLEAMRILVPAQTVQLCYWPRAAASVMLSLIAAAVFAARAASLVPSDLGSFVALPATTGATLPPSVVFVRLCISGLVVTVGGEW